MSETKNEWWDRAIKIWRRHALIFGVISGILLWISWGLEWEYYIYWVVSGGLFLIALIFSVCPEAVYEEEPLFDKCNMVCTFIKSKLIHISYLILIGMIVMLLRHDYSPKENQTTANEVLPCESDTVRLTLYECDTLEIQKYVDTIIVLRTEKRGYAYALNTINDTVCMRDSSLLSLGDSIVLLSDSMNQIAVNLINTKRQLEKCRKSDESDDDSPQNQQTEVVGYIKLGEWNGTKWTKSYLIGLPALIENTNNIEGRKFNTKNGIFLYAVELNKSNYNSSSKEKSGLIINSTNLKILALYKYKSNNITYYSARISCPSNRLKK